MEALISILKTVKHDIIIITETWVTDKNRQSTIKRINLKLNRQKLWNSIKFKPIQ